MAVQRLCGCCRGCVDVLVDGGISAHSMSEDVQRMCQRMCRVDVWRVSVDVRRVSVNVQRVSVDVRRVSVDVQRMYRWMSCHNVISL